MSWTEHTENFATATVAAISVSALVDRAKLALERALPLCWVSGEISGFKRAASGHCYFDLKDDAAQIACVLYRNRAALVGFELKDGAQVELRVRPTIYEPRGSLQFAVEQARLAGVGRLFEAFLRLKAALESEGLFASESKRSLPQFPQRIGLITSTKAAALADMLRVLRDRWPRAQVIVYAASVQGTAAPRELLAALDAANRRGEVDVLIIGRGGGSMEDLWAFNDEALTRAVAASRLPIVSAVGHETDFSLCDFAADLRAATPTAAAALVSPARHALIGHIDSLGHRQQQAMQRGLNHIAERLDRSAERLVGSRALLAPWREAVLRKQHRLQRALLSLQPAQRVRLGGLNQRLLSTLQQGRLARVRVEGLAPRLSGAITQRISDQQTRLQSAERALQLLDPRRVLDRGYALVLTKTGEPVTDASRVTSGQALQIQVQRGDIDVVVSDTQARLTI
jgi:exodeoxyribonuclease VII large subunit